MGFGVLDGMNAAGRIATVAERLMDDAGLRQKFEETGQVAVKIAVEGYEVDIVLRRRDE
jgi:hypothetical protein